MLRNRRRPKESASMKPETKKIFNIPETPNLLSTDIRKYHSSKLALPVVRAIDDYNWNMNGVDINDQLREDLSVQQVTVRYWIIYFFWLIDCTLINAFILWKRDIEQIVVGRRYESMRSQRVFREAVIDHLLKDSPEPRLDFNIIIAKNHQFIEPNRHRLPLRHHKLQRRLPRRRCYMCRIKTLRGELGRDDESRIHSGCLVCEVPLCEPCFIEYHQL